MFGRNLDKPARAWIMYDWASSAFATTVMAGFFPVFFKQYWSAGTDVAISTLRLGTANSTAALIVAVMAPLLGAMADRQGRRKHFLIAFTLLGTIMTAGLYFVGEGAWQQAVAVYSLAIVGFSGANVFYDSLLLTVARPGDTDRVSSIGFAVGYLGGGLLFAINVMMTLFPGAFGLGDAAAAVRLSFLMVGLWWGVFTIPLMRRVREESRRESREAESPGVQSGLREVWETLRQIKRYKSIFGFLAAYWLYIDGVHTIVRMAVDYGLSIGFETSDLLIALLVVQFVAFPAALGFASLAGRFGTKKAILIGVAAYFVISVWASRIQQTWEFYALAVAIGLVQGGVTALSRSFFARLIPVEKSAQFYGFYNAVGRSSAIIGPLLMGWVGYVTGDPRNSILALTVLFLSGGIVLYFVPDPGHPEQ